MTTGNTGAPTATSGWHDWASSSARVVRRGWRRVSRLSRWAVLRTGRLWRSSLQFRVVLTTMILGLVVLVLIQTFIYQRIADGLVEARTNTARDEAQYGVAYVTQRVDSTDKTDLQSLIGVANASMYQLESQDEDNPRELFITPSPSGRVNPASLPWATTGPTPADIPESLRAALTTDPGHQQVLVGRTDYLGSSVPAVFVAQRTAIGATPYELYYIFPMAREEKTLSMIERTFALGSIVFVLLIGLVAYVVTRLVVDPVREAAVVAGRLSGGNLNERMHVRGADDLATLATSFNDMADHLQKQISQLEDLSAVQQRFVSDVSHELRTPLTTIRMASEIIHDERAAFPPAVGRSAELLYGEVERFDDLLSDLLEISRFDAGAAILDREDVDLRVVVDRVLASCATLAERRGSPLLVRGADVPHRAQVDARRVERVLRNLVVNAIEHGEGGLVSVELAGNDTAVALVVRDVGVGLRPGEADLVFNRFWRADPARKRTTGGTGLGLAIALEDARLHDGWLQAWGDPGRGSRFRLVLPRVPGQAIGVSPLPLEEPDAPELPDPDLLDDGEEIPHEALPAAQDTT